VQQAYASRRKAAVGTLGVCSAHRELLLPQGTATVCHVPPQFRRHCGWSCESTTSVQ